jgi:hypothetical protein
VSVAAGAGMSTAQRKNPRALLRHFHYHWKAAGAGPALLEVLMALWCHADMDDATTASLNDLAVEVGSTRSTVRHHVGQAERLGLLNTTKRGSRVVRTLALQPVDNCRYCATSYRAPSKELGGQVRDQLSRTTARPAIAPLNGKEMGKCGGSSETEEPRDAQRLDKIIRTVTSHSARRAQDLIEPTHNGASR